MNHPTERKTKRIAFLAAAACVLQVVESFFPHPFPGVRLGLANVLALLALFDMGFGTALQVTLLRTVVASLTIGTFLSPTFMLSIAGAAGSIAVLGGLHFVTIRRGRVIFSMIGFSILGAVIHTLTQVVVLYFFLGRNRGVFSLLPWLAVTSVGTGLLTGIIAAKAFRLIHSTEPRHAVLLQPERTPLQNRIAHAVPLTAGRVAPCGRAATLKLMAVLTFIGGVVILPRPDVVLPASVLLLLLAYTVSRVPLKTVFGALKRVLCLILFSFIVGVLFAEGTAVGRMSSSALFSGRIVLILLCTTLLTATTSPANLAAGLANLLLPLRAFRLSPARLSHTIVESIESVPRFWRVFQNFRRHQRRTGQTIRDVIPWMAGLLAHFYQEAALAETNPRKEQETIA